MERRGLGAPSYNEKVFKRIFTSKVYFAERKGAICMSNGKNSRRKRGYMGQNRLGGERMVIYGG